MNDPLNLLLGIRLREQELFGETRKKEPGFCYKIHERKVHFTAAAKAKHQHLRLSLHRYLLTSRVRMLFAAPVVWMCLFPIGLVDVIRSIHQDICLPNQRRSQASSSRDRVRSASPRVSQFPREVELRVWRAQPLSEVCGIRLRRHVPPDARGDSTAL